VAQITSVTSEALQAEIRRLLPSQQGFGEDLQASNVITPVIDITGAADGSVLPSYLQTSLNFSTANVEAQNNTQTVSNTSGFYKILATFCFRGSSTDSTGRITINDGTTTKTILQYTVDGNTTNTSVDGNNNFNVFLRAGDTLSATSTATACVVNVSATPIASVNGVLINPLGFTSE